MSIILVLGILDQAMSGWFDKIHFGGHHITFFKIGAMIIGEVGEGGNLEV